MFFSLLIATFLIAAGTAALVVKIFNRPVKAILERIINDSISSAWHRYITFAAFVVGISGGVRIYALERYILPATVPEGEKAPTLPLLNAERWTLEIYRTIIDCLQSMAWMYLVVFLFALVAYVVVRISERKSPRQNP